MHSAAWDMQLLRSSVLRTSAGKSSAKLPTTRRIGPSVFTYFIPLVSPCTDKSPFVHPTSRYFVVTVCVGCVYLPQLLACSNATSELIKFLRGGHFERAYADYNYHSLAGVRFDNFEMEELVPNVLKAIQTYLQVCDIVSTKVLFLTIIHQTSATILRTRKRLKESLKEETTRGTMTHRDQKSGGGCNIS